MSKNTSKTLPVNAPSAESASAAVADMLAKEGRPFVVESVSAAGFETLPDAKVAITVTKPRGPRSTWLVVIAPVKSPAMSPETLSAEEAALVTEEMAENGQGAPVGFVIAEEAAPVVEPAPAFALCGCGCGMPVRRRFLPGHDARLAARVALESGAADAGLSTAEYAATLADARKAAQRDRAKARRAAEAAEYEQALASAKAVAAETPEETAAALAADA